jgi:hypothetical protein
MFIKDLMCNGVYVDSDLFQLALRAYIRQKFFPLVGMKIELFDEENGLEKLREAIDEAARTIFSTEAVREVA